MSHLAISLFGSFRVTLDDRPLTAFATDKTRALLAYLAVESGRPRRREALAALLWPDRPETAARNSLRQALYHLRRALADRRSPAPHLRVTAKEVLFDPGSDHWLDVAEFEARLSACRAHHPQGLTLCPACLARLEAAVQLYHGDFLAGFAPRGCPPFEWWQLVTQEACHRQALEALARLASTYEARRDYAQVSRYAQRETELEPWRESAHRRCMRALALGGQRGEALRQYEVCRRDLAQEMGVEPSAATTRLYQRIREGALPGLASPRAGSGRHVLTPAQSAPAEPRLGAGFCGREPELAALDRRLQAALAGRGGVAFVAGEAGSGKSVLVREFTRRALQARERLLVAGDSCDARVGAGHPYQPFAGILSALTGGGDTPPSAADVAALQARRLEEAFPAIARALLEAGPDLVGTLVPLQTLARRVEALGEAGGEIGREMERLLARSASTSITKTGPNPGWPKIEQAVLFEQMTQFLLALARQRPTILVLDDLQWADEASVHLLFHLGRRLEHSQLLIVGAYRPEDLAPGRDGGRHPLEPVLYELQARYGEVTVDLSRADGRRFIADLVAGQPNQLGADFGQVLYRHTEGHALFAVEMLRGMAARGELVRDAAGRWVTRTEPDWDRLPARVEAVIGERIARLPELCQEALAAASVQGETFVVEVLARALDCRPSQALGRVNRVLGDPHDLVHALSVEFLSAPQGGGPTSRTLCRYRFRHYLYQQYLYHGLDPVARCRLHQVTGETLETVYRSRAGAGEGREASAPYLAWHFERSGQADKAVAYLLQAGQDAFRLSAHLEAIRYLERGLALLQALPDTPARARQELSYLFALNGTIYASKGMQDPARVPLLRRAAALCGELDLTSYHIQVLFMQWSLHLGWGEYDRCLELARQAQALADGEEERWLSGLGAFALGMTYTVRGALPDAARWFEHPALASFVERSRELDYLMSADMHMLRSLLHAMALWGLGYPDRAWAVVQACMPHKGERGHRANLGVANFTMGYIRLLRGERAQSMSYIRELIVLAESSEFPAFRWYADFLGGWEKLLRGDCEQAAGILERHVQFYRSINANVTLSFTCGLQAQAHAGDGALEEGMAAIEEAFALVARTGERFWEAELHRIQGDILALRGDAPGAVSSYRTALDVARRQDARSWELRAANSLCRLWQGQGMRAEARALLAGIYGWFSEGFDAPDLQEAAALLDELS